MTPNSPLFPPVSSTLASKVDAIFLFTVAVSALFILLIVGTLFTFLVKYRRRRADGTGQEIKGNTLVLELAWSLVPLALVLTSFFWGAAIFFESARPPADAWSFHVYGKQWMWKVEHPEGKREINEFHVPVNQAVKLTMTSEDVIHNFSVRTQWLGDHNKFYYNIIDTNRHCPYETDGERAGGIAILNYQISQFNEIANNVITNCDGPGITVVEDALSHDNKIVNNVVMNNGRIGGTKPGLQNVEFWSWGIYSGSNTTITNNLFYNSREPNPIIYHEGPTGPHLSVATFNTTRQRTRWFDVATTMPADASSMLFVPEFTAVGARVSVAVADVGSKPS